MSEQMNILEVNALSGLQVDHYSAVPLHSQVEQLLRKLVHQEEYQAGKLLPREIDLAKHLGISRNTVRQGINKLVQEKLVVRKKGVGTRVAPKEVTTSLDHWFSFSQEMEDQGRNLITYMINTGWVQADDVLARHLEIKRGRQVLRLERLKGQDEGPWVYFVSWFHPRVGLTGQEDFSKHLYQILEQEYATVPVISRERIRAIPAAQTIAEKLEMKEGQPVLFRERVVYDPGNRPVEYNVGYYRGDKFTYAISIQRQMGEGQ